MMFRQNDHVRCHRRHFLTVGAAGALGLDLATSLRANAAPSPSDPAARSRRSRARNVIMIWLGGAPSTIDMWDMKPDAPDGIRGDFSPISTSVPSIRICEHLPRVSRILHRATLIRSLQHGISAHGPGSVYMSTGHPPAAALEYPSLGSLASRLLPATPGVPSYVLFDAARSSGYGGGAGHLGNSCDPFEVPASANSDRRAPLDGIALPRGFSIGALESRVRLQRSLDATFRHLDDADAAVSLDRFQQQAVDILRSDRTRRALDLEREPAPVQDRYGRSPLGQSLLTARRLIEAGVNFVTAGLGGWDTHIDNFGVLRSRLLPVLDRALAALVSDLDARGLLESTIVYCVGEFARTPRINPAAGRDHWARAMAAFLAGGPFCQGAAYGATDRLGQAPESESCTPADVAATIFKALGFEASHEVISAAGRRMPIFRDGNPIDAFVA
jgi:hypothetical protein